MRRMIQITCVAAIVVALGVTTVFAQSYRPFRFVSVRGDGTGAYQTAIQEAINRWNTWIFSDAPVAAQDCLVRFDFTDLGDSVANSGQNSISTCITTTSMAREAA